MLNVGDSTVKLSGFTILRGAPLPAFNAAERRAAEAGRSGPLFYERKEAAAARRAVRGRRAGPVTAPAERGQGASGARAGPFGAGLRVRVEMGPPACPEDLRDRTRRDRRSGPGLRTVRRSTAELS